MTLKVVTLKGGTLQSFTDTGRVLLEAYRFAHLLNPDVLLEQVREDFEGLGMPHVVELDDTTHRDLDKRMIEQEHVFSRWGSVDVEKRTFYGFSELSDVLMARLLL